MKTRAVIYARVSTDEQAEKGYSLSSQIEACERYAKDHQLHVVGIFQDDFTGAKLERPEFNKLREMIRRNEADAIIIYCIDRLTRNLAHSLILREEFDRAGVERHTVSRGLASLDADSRMIENIEGVFAEYEREKIRERISRGMVSKARKGKVVGQGHAPYGYQYIDGQLHLDDNEAEIVKKIFTWFVIGDETTGGKPIPLMAIARRLSEMKVPTPAQKWDGWSHRRLRPPGIWGFTSISRILRNETYAGKWHYRKRIGAGGKQGDRNPKDWIPVDVTPIVSREVWDAVQEQFAINKQLASRNSRRQYLLRGLIRCGSCGKGLSGKPPHDKKKGTDLSNRAHYYFCTTRARQHESAGEVICRQRDVNGKRVEAVVWSYVLELMTDPEILERGLREAQKQERDARQPKQERLQLVKDLIQQCQQDAQTLTQTLTSVTTGKLIGEALQSRIADLEKQYESLVIERDQLAQELSTEQITDEEIEQIKKFRCDFCRGLATATFEEKRRTLELLRVRVVATRDWAKVTCCLPTREKMIDISIQQNDCPTPMCPIACAPCLLDGARDPAHSNRHRPSLRLPSAASIPRPRQSGFGFAALSQTCLSAGPR